MTRTADLLTVLHEIDHYRGRICGSCRYYRRRFGTQFGSCSLGYQPFGDDDGCDEWAKPESVRDSGTA